MDPEGLSENFIDALNEALGGEFCLASYNTGANSTEQAVAAAYNWVHILGNRRGVDIHLWLDRAVKYHREAPSSGLGCAGHKFLAYLAEEVGIFPQGQVQRGLTHYVNNIDKLRWPLIAPPPQPAPCLGWEDDPFEV